MMARGSLEAAAPWADEVAELVTADGAGSDGGRPSAGVSMRYLCFGEIKIKKGGSDEFKACNKVHE